MPLSKTFRENIRAQMARKGLSQQDVANLSGIHFVTVSRILSGANEPTLETCERLAKAVKLAPEKIFEKAS